MNKDLIIQKLKEIVVHVGFNSEGEDILEALNSIKCTMCARLAKELAALESEQEEPEQSSSEELMIEKAIIEMIEANLPIKGFKEWMIEKQFDHNTSYSEFYAENDEGYMMHGINKLYRHWKRTAWKGKEQK